MKKGRRFLRTSALRFVAIFLGWSSSPPFGGSVELCSIPFAFQPQAIRVWKGVSFVLLSSEAAEGSGRVAALGVDLAGAVHNVHAAANHGRRTIHGNLLIGRCAPRFAEIQVCQRLLGICILQHNPIPVTISPL